VEVVEPMIKEGRVPIRVSWFTERSPEGALVAIPTSPPPFTMKRVPPVVEPMVKSGAIPSSVPASIENLPHGEVVERPTKPMLETLRRLVLTPAEVEEPIAKRVVGRMVLVLEAACTDRSAYGEVVLIPVRPRKSIRKEVIEEEPMAKAGATPSPSTGLMESLPHGVLEPTPTKPVEVKVVDAVPPMMPESEEKAVVEAYGAVSMLVLSLIHI
jgi:hypothetical protein